MTFAEIQTPGGQVKSPARCRRAAAASKTMRSSGLRSSISEFRKVRLQALQIIASEDVGLADPEACVRWGHAAGGMGRPKEEGRQHLCACAAGGIEDLMDKHREARVKVEVEKAGET